MSTCYICDVLCCFLWCSCSIHVMFYNVLCDVRIVYMWCSRRIFLMFTWYTCNVLCWIFAMFISYRRDVLCYIFVMFTWYTCYVLDIFFLIFTWYTCDVLCCFSWCSHDIHAMLWYIFGCAHSISLMFHDDVCIHIVLMRWCVIYFPSLIWVNNKNILFLPQILMCCSGRRMTFRP
jgi:hypothetical protein